MSRLSDTDFDRAAKAGQALDVAASKMRVLSSMVWDADLRERFLKTRALPKPEYPSVDTAQAREAIKNARANIDGDHVVMAWLSRLADTLETTANMIDARGTPEFFTHSKALYGEPTKLMLDGKTRVLDLARHMDGVLAGLDFDKLVMAGEQAELSSAEFAAALRPLLAQHFGEDAPEVLVTANVSAKAAAGMRRIRVRKDARFTPRDIDQLLQHEALIHVATALNGRAQTHFPILGRAHAGTTEVQEGIAVFAEMISGAMDPRRFRRLSGRVLAIDMAARGADFKEVFDFFMGRVEMPEQAFENTRRIFRGGLITGGAPFTKDMVYLNGLLRVHNFMRSVVKLGRADLIRVLFCGKMDIEDVPALAQLASADRLSGPKFLPPWVKDLRFLVSYMAYSSFLNQVKMPGFQAYYETALKDVPNVWDLGEG